MVRGAGDLCHEGAASMEINYSGFVCSCQGVTCSGSVCKGFDPGSEE